MSYANRIGAIVATLLAAIGIASLILTSHANAQPKINGNQLVFVIGAGNKESFFEIADESRGKTQYWLCGFIHNFQPNEFGGFTPAVQCNKIN